MTNEEKLNLLKQVLLDYDEYHSDEPRAASMMVTALIDIIEFRGTDNGE